MYDCPMHCAERDGHIEALREALNELKSALEEQGRLLDLGSAADAERAESLVDVFEVQCEEAAARYRIHLEQHACIRAMNKSAASRPPRPKPAGVKPVQWTRCRRSKRDQLSWRASRTFAAICSMV
jgi:outer membrane protein TolC